MALGHLGSSRCVPELTEGGLRDAWPCHMALVAGPSTGQAQCTWPSVFSPRSLREAQRLADARSPSPLAAQAGQGPRTCPGSGSYLWGLSAPVPAQNLLGAQPQATDACSWPSLPAEGHSRPASAC